ncbi:MAG: hypothetical protein ABSA23_15890 [Anaerolineales bacterium]
MKKTAREIHGPRWQETFAALKYYDYRLRFGGQAVSPVGTWLQSTTQAYLIYHNPGSPAAVIQ